MTGLDVHELPASDLKRAEESPGDIAIGQEFTRTRSALVIYFLPLREQLQAVDYIVNGPAIWTADLSDVVPNSSPA